MRKELEAALAPLRELESADRLGVGYGGKPAAFAAITASPNLVAALEAEDEDSGIDRRRCVSTSTTCHAGERICAVPSP